MADIDVHLGDLRRKRGVSAVFLANAVGVSRQTIYAMEAGTYVPNTAVALRLAQVLETTVEELFALGGQNVAGKLQTKRVKMMPGTAPVRAGQAVQLCQVDKQLIASAPSPVAWSFPATDAVATADLTEDGRGRVRLFQAEADFSNRILVAGCDPGISVLARHVQAAGIELVVANRNSSVALSLLKDGCVHLAGTHLVDEASGESNLPLVRKMFAKESVAVVSFAVWEEGLVMAAGNPKSIAGVRDLTRQDVWVVNREPGSGSRALLDAELKKLSIQPKDVRGYENTAEGHLPACWQVQSGTVDCCLATRAAARAMGLDFIPLVSERYDLVLHRQHLALPRMQNLFDVLSRSGFRRELEGFGGYDTRLAGQRLL